MAIYLFGLNPKQKITVPIPENITPELLKELEIYEIKLNSEVPGGVISFPVRTWRTIGRLLEITIESDLRLSEPALSFSEDRLLELNNVFNLEPGAKLDAETCELLEKITSELIIFLKLVKYDTIYCNLGVWTRLADHPGTTQEITDRLNEIVPLEGIVYLPVSLDNNEYVPSYSCTLDDLEVFANFLDNCNGFLIQ